MLIMIFLLFSAKFTLHYCDGEKIQSSERSIDRWIDRVNNPGGCLVGSYFLYSSKFLIFCYFCTCKTTVGHSIYISIYCVSNFGHFWLTTDLIINNHNMKTIYDQNVYAPGSTPDSLKAM